MKKIIFLFTLYLKHSFLFETQHKIVGKFSPIRWYMKKRKFKGWTSFWNTIYYIDEDALNDEKLKRHELHHIKQIKKCGRLKFAIHYSLWTYLVGYRKNPFEVNARWAETVDGLEVFCEQAR